jgi:hypothetical protein
MFKKRHIGFLVVGAVCRRVFFAATPGASTKVPGNHHWNCSQRFGSVARQLDCFARAANDAIVVV